MPFLRLYQLVRRAYGPLLGFLKHIKALLAQKDVHILRAVSNAPFRKRNLFAEVPALLAPKKLKPPLFGKLLAALGFAAVFLGVRENRVMLGVKN